MTRTITLKLAGLAIAAAVTGTLFLAAAPAGAQTRPTYTYSSPVVFLYAGASGWYCQNEYTILNASGATVNATVKEWRGGVLTNQTTTAIQSGGTAYGSFYMAGTYGWVRTEIVAPSGRLVVSSRPYCVQGNTKTEHDFDSSEWTVTNPNGSTSENLQRANGMLDAIAAKIDAANGKLDALAAKVGNKTTSVCVDGSVRSEPTNRNQMYLTLFNPANGAIANASVTYNTNLGPVYRTYGVGPLQRVQIDVSSQLVGPTGVYPLRTDVDTVVTVTAAIALHVNCSVYFSKTVGAVGLVTGALELPVSSN